MSSRGPRPTTIDAGRAGGPGHLEHEQPEQARAEHDGARTRPEPGPAGRVHGQRALVDQGGGYVTHRGRDLVQRDGGPDRVLREGAGRGVAVQLEAGLPDPLAQVVPARPAHRAAAAAGVVLRHHPVPHGQPAALGARPEFGDLAGPFVPDDERQRRRPGAPVGARHDLQVGAADAAGPDPDQHLARAGLGHRDAGHLQAAELPQQRGLHRAHSPSPTGSAAHISVARATAWSATASAISSARSGVASSGRPYQPVSATWWKSRITG